MKRFSHIVFTFLFLAGVLTSCQDELSKAVVIGGTSFRDHKISSRIEVVPSPDEGPETKSSFAGNESRIDTWTLIQLDEGTSKVVKAYTWTRKNADDTPNISNIEVQYNKEYRWYAVANAAVPSSIVPGAARSVVEAMVLACIPKDSTSTATTLPMAWKSASTSSYTKADLSGDNPATLNVSFDRLVAKWSVTLDKSLLSQYGFTATGLQLKGTGTVTPFAASKASSALTVTDQATAADLSSLNAGNAVVFYTLENMNGSGSSVLKTIGGNAYQKKQSNIKEGVYPSYIEVTGTISVLDGSNLSIPGTYRFYLGADNTQDFDVVRNRRSTVTLCPTDEWVNNAIKEVKQEADWTMETPIWKVEAGDFTDTRSVAWEHASDPGYIQLPTDGSILAEGVVASLSGLKRKFKLSSQLYEGGSPVAHVYLDAGMSQDVTPASANTWVSVDAAASLYFCAPAGHAALEGVATVATLDGRKSSDIEVRVGRRLSDVRLHLVSNGEASYQSTTNYYTYSQLSDAYTNNTALWQTTKGHKDTLFFFINYGNPLNPLEIRSATMSYLVTAHYSDGTEANITESVDENDFTFSIQGLDDTWRTDLTGENRYGLRVYVPDKRIYVSSNGYQTAALNSLYNNRYVTVSYTEDGVTKSGTARISCFSCFAPTFYVSAEPVVSHWTMAMNGLYLSYGNHLPWDDSEKKYVIPNRLVRANIRSAINMGLPQVDGYSMNYFDITSDATWVPSVEGVVSLSKTSSGYTLTATTPGTTTITVSYVDPASFVVLPGHNCSTLGSFFVSPSTARSQYASSLQPMFQDKTPVATATIPIRVRELESLQANGADWSYLNVIDVLGSLSEGQVSSTRTGSVDFNATFINESYVKHDVEADTTVRFNDKAPTYYSPSHMSISSLQNAIDELKNKDFAVSPLPGYYGLFRIKSITYDDENQELDYTWEIRKVSESTYNNSSNKYEAGDYLLKATYSYGDVTRSAYFGLLCDLYQPVGITVKPATTSMYLYECKDIAYTADLQYRYKSNNVVYSNLTDITTTYALRQSHYTASTWELIWTPNGNSYSSNNGSYSFPTYTTTTTNQNMMRVWPQSTTGTLNVTGTFAIGTSSVSGNASISVTDPGTVTNLEIVIPEGYPGPNGLTPATSVGLLDDGQGTRLQAFATFSNGQRLNVTNSADWLWNEGNGGTVSGSFESKATRQVSTYVTKMVGSKARTAGYVCAGGTGYGNAHIIEAEFADIHRDTVTASITLKNAGGDFSELLEARTRKIGGTYSTSPLSISVGESFEVSFYYRNTNGSWYLVAPDDVTITNSSLLTLSSDSGSSRIYVSSSQGQVSFRFTRGALESNTAVVNIVGATPTVTYRLFVGDADHNEPYNPSIHYGEAVGFYAWMQRQENGVDVDSPVDVSSHCTWTLNPPGFGEVSSVGLYTAPASGTSQQDVEVRAEYTGTEYEPTNDTDYATVTVRPAPSGSYLDVDPSALSWDFYQTDGKVVSVSSNVAWNVEFVTGSGSFEVSSASGSGNGSVTVNPVGWNDGDSNIEGRLRFYNTAESLETFVDLTQYHRKAAGHRYYSKLYITPSEATAVVGGSAVHFDGVYEAYTNSSMTGTPAVTYTNMPDMHLLWDNEVCVTANPGNGWMYSNGGVDFTGVVEGTVTVMLNGDRPDSWYDTVQKTATLTVTETVTPPTPVTEYQYQVVVTPASATIEASGSQQFTATLQYRSKLSTDSMWPAVWMDLDSDINHFNWSSSNSGAAHILIEGGIVKAVGVNNTASQLTTEIKAVYNLTSCTEGSVVHSIPVGTYGAANFYVNGTVALDTIKFTKSQYYVTGFNSLDKKFYKSTDYIVKAYYSDGTSVTITDDSEIAYETTNSVYVNIDTKGTIRAVAIGSEPEVEGQITASYKGKTTTARWVSINYEVPIISLSVNSDNYDSSGPDGQKFRLFSLTYTVRYCELITGYEVLDVTEAGRTWSTSQYSVSCVDLSFGSSAIGSSKIYASANKSSGHTLSYGENPLTGYYDVLDTSTGTSMSDEYVEFDFSISVPGFSTYDFSNSIIARLGLDASGSVYLSGSTIPTLYDF